MRYENDVRQYSAIKTVKVDSSDPHDIPIHVRLNTIDDVSSSANYTEITVDKLEKSSWKKFPASVTDETALYKHLALKVQFDSTRVLIQRQYISALDLLAGVGGL